MLQSMDRKESDRTAMIKYHLHYKLIKHSCPLLTEIGEDTPQQTSDSASEWGKTKSYSIDN